MAGPRHSGFVLPGSEVQAAHILHVVASEGQYRHASLADGCVLYAVYELPESCLSDTLGRYVVHLHSGAQSHVNAAVKLFLYHGCTVR